MKIDLDKLIEAAPPGAFSTVIHPDALRALVERLRAAEALLHVKLPDCVASGCREYATVAVNGLAPRVCDAHGDFLAQHVGTHTKDLPHAALLRAWKATQQ